MNEKVIDLSKIDEAAAERIMEGWKALETNTHCDRYFGYVDKATLKYLVKKFGYFDVKTFVGGGIVGAGLVLAYGFYKMYIQQKQSENNG